MSGANELEEHRNVTKPAGQANEHGVLNVWTIGDAARGGDSGTGEVGKARRSINAGCCWTP